MNLFTGFKKKQTNIFFVLHVNLEKKKEQLKQSTIWNNQHEPMGCSQDSTWCLMDRQTAKSRAAAGASRCSLNDGSWSIVGDSFSESDVGEWIDPERRQ